LGVSDRWIAVRSVGFVCTKKIHCCTFQLVLIACVFSKSVICR